MKIFFNILALFIPSLSFAFYCPTNFIQIDYGMTPDQVKAACGNPDKENTKDAEPKTPQEWTYMIPSPVSNQAMALVQGTLKATVAFDKDGKVINIQANGIGVGSSGMCGSNIKLGDSIETVKAACGKPAYLTKAQLPPSEGGDKQDNKVTTFIYNSNPPVKLIFEGGKLTKRE